MSTHPVTLGALEAVPVVVIVLGCRRISRRVTRCGSSRQAALPIRCPLQNSIHSCLLQEENICASASFDMP